MDTQGCLLIREKSLEGRINLDELDCRGSYPSEFISIFRGRAKKAAEKSFLKSAKKNGYSLIVLSNESEENNGRSYKVTPTFYTFQIYKTTRIA